MERKKGADMDGIHNLIGSNAETITWWQMSIRAIFIFFSGLVLVRFGGKRIFGKNASFDIVLGVILGSILSRALTANARFFPTLAAAATLVLLHMLLAKIAFRNKTFGHLVKGMEDRLVVDGAIDWKTMKKTNITEHDLREAARLKGSVMGLEKVREAFLERSGDISVIKK
jgi:uncharacterized membrane protein YcaP (DUF421 family)